MIEVRGWLQQAGRSKRAAALLTVDARGVVVVDNVVVGAASGLSYSSRIGNTRRFVELPDGSSFETEDNDAIDAIERRFCASRPPLHALESHWRFAASAVLALVVIGWLFFAYGLPAISERVAHALPVSAVERLGSGIADAFESEFDPSALPERKREALQALFSSLTPADSAFNYRLRIVKSDRFGSNAFALPDGTIFVTDDLIGLADNFDHVAAVLHHEIAHVELRHGLQNILRASALTTLVYSLTGDASGLGALVLAAPAILLQTQYSRGFETEADLYAVRALHRGRRDPRAMVRMLDRLQGDTDLGALGYISTHPLGDVRLEPLRAEIQRLGDVP
ncbi:MAG: M48 family metallopeptidase [Pseudomonadota bacterium]